MTGEFGQVLLLVSQYWWKIASSFVYLESGHKRWRSYWSNRKRGSKASKWCCHLAVVMNKVMVVFLLLCIAGSLEGVEKSSGVGILHRETQAWAVKEQLRRKVGQLPLVQQLGAEPAPAQQ